MPSRLPSIAVLALAAGLAITAPASAQDAVIVEDPDTVVETVETVVVPADEVVVETVAVVPVEDAGGMPQLDSGSWPAQLFWLAVIFAGFYFFLARVALPRVSTVLEERRDRIANDLDQAALLQKRGDEALAAYEQSLAEARNRASGIAREMRESVSSENERLSKQLEEDLSRKAAEAEARIQASRDAAMANVTEIAAEAAEAIVVRITGQAPDRARTEAAVASALN